MLTRFYPRPNGFSLIEILLVLIIISAIIVGTFVFYPRVRDAAVSREEAGFIVSLMSEVRQLYPAGNYGALVSDDLVGGTSLPQNYYTVPSDAANTYSGAVMANRWGAAIEVYPVQLNGTRVAPSATAVAPAFAIRYWGLTPSLCRNLASHLLKDARAMMIDDGAVDGPLQVVRNTYLNVEDDPSAIATGCRDNGNQLPRLIVVSN